MMKALAPSRYLSMHIYTDEFDAILFHPLFYMFITALKIS